MDRLLSTRGPNAMRIRYLGMALILAAGAPASADSLFSTASAIDGTLISDQKVRFEVGDIITVLVQEAVSAQTTAGTDTEKQSDLTASAAPEANPFLENFVPDKWFPNWNVSVDHEHEADGTTQRSNRLTLVVSCIVKEVLPNGNVRIEGSKQVTVNREDTHLVLSGIVRARDVTPSNTVTSNQVANAMVELKGHGPLWNNERRGFFTRMFDWVSPF